MTNWLKRWLQCDSQKIDQLLALALTNDERVQHMAGEIDDLKAAITDLGAEVGNVETSLDTLEQKLLAAVAGGDMSAVTAAAADVRAMKERLAAARVASEDNDANT